MLHGPLRSNIKSFFAPSSFLIHTLFAPDYLFCASILFEYYFPTLCSAHGLYRADGVDVGSFDPVTALLQAD